MRRASRYEPDVNRTYHDLAVHYGTAVLPARPRSPQDKAKVEAAVQNVERWVLAPLRNHRFFSLSEVREAIAPLLAALNERSFQKIEGSRRSLFEDLDRPALKPLPAERYEYAEWRKARVNIDYHIQVDGRFYSVPHALARREVEVRLAATTVEIFRRHRRVAAHIRGRRKGGYTTDPGHMPAAHRAHLEWTPSRLVRWARRTGPETAAFARTLLENRPHPEQGYRSCLGLMRLARAYPPERMEAACRRALDIGAVSYKSVKTILSAGLDQAVDGDQRLLSLPADHVHIRGPDYYANSPSTTAFPCSSSARRPSGNNAATCASRGSPSSTSTPRSRTSTSRPTAARPLPHPQPRLGTVDQGWTDRAGHRSNGIRKVLPRLRAGATRRAASASRPATTASPASSTHSPSPGPTVPTPSSSNASPGPGSSSSMTGGSLPCQARDGTICSKSSTTAMPAAVPSSPHSSPSNTGTTSSATPPSETPSSTGSSTTPTASPSRVAP